MDDLTSTNERELREIIARIESELAGREKKQRQQAISEIKRTADSAGLIVNIREKGQKRRGRPAKNKDV